MKTAARKRPVAAPPERRRKNVRLDQKKLRKAQRILGAKTETETIERALDLVVFQEEATAGMRRMIGKGGFTNYFKGDDEP